MNIDLLKLYIPAPKLIIQPKPRNKNYCLAFFGENITFEKAYRALDIRPNQVRYIFVPKIVGPVRTWLLPQYRKTLKSHKLVPITGFFGDYSFFEGKNFFVDYTLQLDRLILKYDIDTFHTDKAVKRLGTLFSTIDGIPQDKFERILLYCVSLDDPISKNIRRRRFFLIYNMLLNYFKLGTPIPFDKILMYVYSSLAGGRYILLFDKSKPNNSLGRLRTILIKMKMIDDEKEEENNNNEEAEDIAKDSLILVNNDKSKQEKIKLATKHYISTSPELVGNLQKMTTNIKVVDRTVEEKNKIAMASMLSHTIGDPEKAYNLSNKLSKMPIEIQKKVMKKVEVNVLPKYPPKMDTINPIVRISEPDKLVQGSPQHILEKRKSDFRDSLKEDIVDAFKVLSKKEHPVKVTSIKVSTIETGPDELKKSIKDQYNINLTLEDGRHQSVMVELPHLTEYGTFYTNGMKKVLLNQIITYPIFFFKPYSGKFTSAYSTVSIYSKMLKKASYLLLFMCGYKMPMIMYLSYKLGFDEVMKSYGIKYIIGPEKLENSIPLPSTGVTKKYITFTTNTDLGEQIVESFKYSYPSFPVPFDVTSNKDWQKVLENHIGNRNCTYLLDQVWENVVTPIEIKLLESKGDPTNIRDIIRYIAGEVVTGRMDDRNGLDKQRIRTSEIFTSQLQKQILAAYNEYESKLEFGDKTAEIYLNPRKIFSEIINAQNVQMLENVNPVEELSMMCRVTPIGVGGIPDKLAVPTKSLNVHSTYYGNIDTLETPDGEGVGIQQHLAIGASISNIRGTFMLRDRSTIKPGEILSTTTSMIPYVESNESARVLMASGQSKQAVPLKNPEIPATMTGVEATLVPLLSDSFIKKAAIDGTIIEVTDKIITIKNDTTGEISNIDIRPMVLKSGQGKDGLSL